MQAALPGGWLANAGGLAERVARKCRRPCRAGGSQMQAALPSGWLANAGGLWLANAGGLAERVARKAARSRPQQRRPLPRRRALDEGGRRCASAAPPGHRPQKAERCPPPPQKKKPAGRRANPSRRVAGTSGRAPLVATRVAAQQRGARAPPARLGNSRLRPPWLRTPGHANVSCEYANISWACEYLQVSCPLPCRLPSARLLT